MPVLPDVGSTMVPPAFSRPSRSADSIIARPIRSLIDPPGLLRSDLINTSASGNSRATRICGVWPMVSRIELRSEEHTSELQSLMHISYADYFLTKQHIT